VRIYTPPNPDDFVIQLKAQPKTRGETARYRADGPLQVLVTNCKKKDARHLTFSTNERITLAAGLAKKIDMNLHLGVILLL
jgi:hypothetical protein